MYFGIDVSKCQGNIDWKKVKENNQKVEFAMLRTGWGKKSSTQIDKKFKDNLNGARDVGINCEAYHYSYADSIKDAVDEANFCLEIINGEKLEYPIVFDYEDRSIKYVEYNLQSEICRAFCDVIEKANYYSMIYVNYDWYTKEIDGKKLSEKYDFWLADWYKEYPRVNCGIHQFDDKGLVNGVYTGVDLNYSYKDYPEIMKEKGINGYKKEESNNNETKNKNNINNIVTKKEHKTYVVKKGDTFLNIAKTELGDYYKYKQIMELNDLKSSTIVPNQILKLN